MPISITNHDDSWTININAETALLARSDRYIIPLSDGCPRCQGEPDLYDPEKSHTLDHKGEFTMFMINFGYAQYLPTCYLIDYGSIRTIFSKPKDNDILVVKPVQGRNGQGIRLIKGYETIVGESECVVSAYIGGATEYIATMFCLNGKIICSRYVSGQFSNEPYIKTSAIEGCQTVSDDICDQCNRCFQLIIKDLDYSGIICSNFKICDEGLKIFEINPRMGATMISHQELFNEFIQDIIIGLKARQVN